jgi:hypothetical protein
VNITNAGYGAVGSYSIVFGSLGTGLPYDFMKEIQVKTSGYEAEFGMSTGGVVNVVTKSGTNLFAGTGFGYFQPDALEAGWKQITLANGAVNTTGRATHDIGIQVGGPAVRDRVFWIAAINPVWENRTFVAQGLPLASLGEVERKRTLVNYAAKGTFQLNSNNRIEASFYGDPAKGDMGPQRIPASLRATDTAAFSEIEYGGHQQVGKYDGIFGSRWLVEASIARSANKISETPSVNEWRYRDRRVTPTITTGGIGFYEVGNDGENIQYAVKSTNIFGGHQLRYGFAYEDIKYDNIIQRTGPTFTLANGEQTVTGAEVDILPDPTFGAIYRVTRANLGNVRETKQQYPSFFIQDSWQVSDRLTIRPGVRYDQQKLVGNLADFQWDGNWAPRIGVTYDPSGEGRAKIFGNWGRFYAKIPNDLAARALSADAGVTRADYFDADLTRPIPNGVRAADTETHFITAGLSAADFDPDSRSTYSDEWVVGAEHELFSGVNVGINYAHRRFGRVLEDVGTLPMIAYFLEDVPGADSVEYFITNPGANTPVAGNLGVPITFEEAIHDYDAVTLTADKRFGSGWGLQSSYRWSRLHGNFEGFFRNDNDQSDPGITSLFDFPTNDPTYAEIGGPQEGFRGDIRFLGAAGAGPLPLDRPHQFKVYGTRVFPMGVTVGLGFNAQSGTPLTALAANPVYDSDGEIPETPRGAGFETVDGFRDRTPWTSTFDVHVDYRIPLPGVSNVTLVADVFNLLDTQDVTGYDNYTESAFQVPNPDFGRVIAYQTPRLLRIGARLSW